MNFLEHYLSKYEIAFNRNIKFKRLQKLSEQPVY
jgi:hypothetical protein